MTRPGTPWTPSSHRWNAGDGGYDAPLAFRIVTARAPRA